MNNNYYSSIPQNEDTVETILKKNKGKKIKLNISIPTSGEYQNKIIEGIIEQSGKDHITISNPSTGEWTMIPLIYINFITFEEPVNYKTEYFLPN